MSFAAGLPQVTTRRKMTQAVHRPTPSDQRPSGTVHELWRVKCDADRRTPVLSGGSSLIYEQPIKRIARPLESPNLRCTGASIFMR